MNLTSTSVLAHPAAAASSSIVFVDPTVPDALMLIAGVAPGTVVYMLSPVEDAVGQITETLMKHYPVSSLHIVSHGRSGELEIGNQWLNLDNLHNYDHQLQSWSAALTANAEILLYGCEVGKDDRGWQFVSQLSQLTGAIVAASDDMTGNAELGGDWDLETSTSPIHSTLPFLPETLHHYQATLGDEFRVNTTTANIQQYSALTALADGGFVVTWSSVGQDGSGGGIYAQRYNASGTPLGMEFRVNTTTTNDQNYSSVVALADGGFVVTWSSWGQDGSGYGIHGKRYAASGTPVGGEFRVNTTTTNDQTDPSVIALADGGFVVTWSSLGQDGSSWGIYGQRYAASGTPVGAEFQVNATTTNHQLYSSVIALADGGFVVTWSSGGQDGSGYGVYGQRYNASGTASGPEFRVNTTTTNHQIYSSGVALANGGFVVTWSSYGQDGSSWGIYGQRYAASGTPIGTEFRVNTTTTTSQISSSVVALADGSFVVTWSSYSQDGSDWGIYGKRYAADGSPVGDEFLVNQTTVGNQYSGSWWDGNTIDQLVNGNVVVTWTGSGTGDAWGVFARILEFNQAPTDISLFSVTSNSFGVGRNPTEVAIADLNGDTMADLVTSFLFNPSRSPSISVLLGDGLGGFTSNGNFGEALHPYALAVGDFNGDGKTDAVTANAFAPSSMLLGDGLGNLTPAGYFGVSGTPRDVAVEDFNADGEDDLAIATDNALTVLLGNGLGTFVPAIDYGIGVAHASVKVGDFNGDNHADLVTADPDADTVSVFLNDGLGNFNPATSVGVGDRPTSVAIGDFNSDGRADLVVANSDADTVSVLIGDGAGGFTPTDTISAGDRPFWVEVGDFNGDSKDDLAVLASVSALPSPLGTTFGEVSILLGDGAGNFSPSGTFVVGVNPSSMAIADLDGNGTDDLAISNFYSDNVSVLLTQVNNAMVDENVPIGTIVGTFATTDPDTGDTFTYSLVTGIGSADNSAFTLDGNQLKLAESPNFEAKSAYNIRIRVTDQDGAFHEEVFTIQVNDLNEAPTIGVNNSALTTNEGQSVSNTGTFGDVDAGDTVSLSASVGMITRQRNGTWRWSYTPNDGPDQSQLVTITATDSKGVTTTETFSLLVKNINPTATFSNGGAVNEGNTGTVSFSRQADRSIVDAASLRYSYDFNNDGIWEFGGIYENSVTDSSVTVPIDFLADGPSARTIKGRILDKDGGFTDYTTTITVRNVAPALTGTLATLAIGTEDTPYLITTADLLAGFTDVPGDPLSISNLRAMNGGVVNNNNGTYTFTPATNFNGIVNLNYNVIDGDGGRTAATQSFSLTPVNDAPRFTKGANQTILAGAGAQTVANWATNFSPGPGNESAQTVQQYQFVSNSNPSLFIEAPTIDVNGNLTYTPGSLPGTATLSVQVQDNGGTANGGIDTSAAQTFTITLRPQTVSLNAIDTTAAESGGDNGLYRISRNFAGGSQTIQLAIAASSTATFSANPLTNDYSFSLSGTGVAAGATLNMVGNTLTVVLPDGVASADLVLIAADDIQAEAAETVRLNLQASSAYAIGGSTTGTVTIAQNDFVVTNTNNAGEGSLRQAVLNASAIAEANTITFAGPVFTDATPDTITLTTGQLILTDTTTIQGLGANMLTISGGNNSRVFSINSGVTATLNDLTIANGNAVNAGGGGILNNGNLTLNTSTLKSNQADRGGGIVNSASLTINSSTLSGNAATVNGGGIYNGHTSVLAINNSTLSGNSANVNGGGIFNSSNQLSNGNVTVTNSTVTGNSSSSNGGGIWSSGVVTVRNSIWGGNSAQNGAEVYNYSYPGNSFTSGGYNLVGQTSNKGGFVITTTDIVLSGAIGTAIQPLANNGGPTQTHALTAGSAAINAGNNALLPAGTTIDQRGFDRIVGGNVDIGAVESSFKSTVTLTAIDTTAAESGNNTGIYRISRGSDTAGNLAVKLNLSGSTDLNPSDYTLSGGSISIADNTATIVIPTGQSFIDLILTAVDDIQGEAAESLTLSLAADPAYNLGGSMTGTVTIAANDFVVTNTNDSGEGSLRQAILNANAIAGANTITFAGPVFTDATPDTITLTTGQLTLADTTTIQGLGANMLTISGGNSSRVFSINSGVTAILDSITIANGNSGPAFGGGINNQGNLAISNSILRNNYTQTWGAGIWNNNILTVNNTTFQNNSTNSSNGAGGGIFNSGGTVTVNSSTFTGSTVRDGGGIFNNAGGNLIVNSSTFSNSQSNGGGGIFNALGTATINSSTISGNRANGWGAGLWNAPGSVMTLSNSTVSGNTSGVGGGGVWNEGGNLTVVNSTLTGNRTGSRGGGAIWSNGVVNVSNSIVAGNTASVGTEVRNEGGTFTSNGYNLVGQNGNQGGFVTTTTDIILQGAIGTAIQPLADNGGPTQTHTLTAGSAAINGGSNALLPAGTATDQRGFSRILGGIVDIGAVESPSFVTIVAPNPAQDSTLLGGNGNEVLQGGNANDTLIGGRGNDYLVGGLGADFFSFGTNTDVQPFSALGHDTIADFSGLDGDRIILGNGAFTALISPVGGTLVGADFATVTSDLAAGDSNAAIVYNSSNGNLFYNLNGNTAGFGAGGQFAQLSNLSPLDASTFLVQV